MRIALVFCLGVAVSQVAGGGEVRTGPTPVNSWIVREYGGKARIGQSVYLLDIVRPSPRVLHVDLSSGVARATELKLTADAVLAPYGLARSVDGSLWALGDKGRLLLRFDGKTGNTISVRPPPDPSQGIWSLKGAILLSPIIREAGKPILTAGDGGAFRAFTSLRSRKAPDLVSMAIANLFGCGSGLLPELPCWWRAGDPELLIINAEGEVRRLEAPRFPADAPASEGPVSGWRHPVRDIFLLSSDSFWLLSDQEGSERPWEDGAVRSRHLLLVGPSGPERVLSLPQEGRAILDADRQGVLLLNADGTVRKVLSR